MVYGLLRQLDTTTNSNNYLDTIINTSYCSNTPKDYSKIRLQFISFFYVSLRRRNFTVDCSWKNRDVGITVEIRTSISLLHQ